MSIDEPSRWICLICQHEERASEPGARCPGHPDRVLVSPRSLEKFADDRVLGRLVADKYAVYDVLGMGGFGAVYRAVQEPVGRPVALKLVHAHNAGDPELRARFFREARVVARLKDPAVVTLHDYGEVPDLGLYMVFELVEGVTLNRLLREGPQPAARVAHIALQLLRALGEAHAMGMVHRDLKPANVMLVSPGTDDESVRLLDFGIAKVLAKEDQEMSLQTQRGLVMGTPRYLSPEQARATDEVDLRSDIYSLGVMIYSLLAGANPFERPSVIETIMAHCNTPPPPLDPSLGVPPTFEAAVLRALEKEPDARYQSAAEMAEAITSSLPYVAFPSGRWHLRTPYGHLSEVEAGGQTPRGLSAASSGASSAPGLSGASSGASSAPGLSGASSGAPSARGLSGAASSAPSARGLSAGSSAGGRGEPAGPAHAHALAEPVSPTPSARTYSGVIDPSGARSNGSRRRGALLAVFALLFGLGTAGGLWWSGALGDARATAVVVEPSPDPSEDRPPILDPAPGSVTAGAVQLPARAIEEEEMTDAPEAAEAEPASSEAERADGQAAKTRRPRRRPPRRARPEAEAPASEAEAPGSKPEAPARETEAPGSKPEAPARETEASAAEAETPAKRLRVPEF